jgi:hypothetical protein
MDVEFADGRVRAQAEGASPAETSTASPAVAPSKPRSRRSGGDGQGSLFGG